MKKTLMLIMLFSVAMAGVGQKHKINVQRTEQVADRSSYRFECKLAKPVENGYFSAIHVKGYVNGSNILSFECEYELVDYVEAGDESSTEWIKDWDINFDGYPDLLIFRWRDVRGRVADYYAGYLWNPKGYFEKVEGFEDVVNPELNPDTKTIVSSVRTDINEFTTWTYEWKGNSLEMIKEVKEKMWDE